MDLIEPNKQDVLQLIGFLPTFKQVGYEPLLGWDHNDSDDKTTYFPTPIYAPEVTSFFEILLEPKWCDFNYDPSVAGTRSHDPEYIKIANLHQLKSLLTFCTRAERFCDGAWASAILDGRIVAILERMLQLSDQQ